MSWCRPVFFSNAASATEPRSSVNAPGATPQSTPQVGTSFSPVWQRSAGVDGSPGAGTAAPPGGRATPADAAGRGPRGGGGIPPPGRTGGTDGPGPVPGALVRTPACG